MTGHHGLALIAAIVGFVLGTTSLALAQAPADAELRLAQPGVPDGIGHYVPGSWGTIRFRIANPADRDVEGLFVAFFADDPEQQFARRLWVPARATRDASLPVLTPRTAPKDSRQVDIKSFLVAATGSSEVLLQHGDTEKLYAAPVVLERRPVAVVTITDVDSPWKMEVETWLEAFEAVQVARFGASQLLELPRDYLPVMPEALEGMSGLVILGNRLVHEPAAMRAVREWVNDGGSLWIMLDLVEPETVRRLLGDEFQHLPVDRAGLTEVKFEKPDGGASNLPLREFEQPVDLVRLELSGAEVIHTVNGWPASSQQKLGRGRVIFTTLGAQAWVTPRNVKTGREGAVPASKHELTEPVKEVFDRFFEPADRSIPSPEKLESVVTKEIGYEILDRGQVLAVLGSFCSCLFVVGLWLERRQRLEQMVWVLPLAALAAAVPLALAADFRRQSVPPTAAVVQIMEVARGHSEAIVTGLAAMYEAQPWTAPLATERHGILLPDRTDRGGTIRRMVWTDLDSAAWENLKFPAGLSLAKFQFPQHLEERFDARVRFDRDGLTGTIPTGLLLEPADGAIATSSQRVIGVQFAADGTFRAGQQDVLAPHQYVAGTLLSDAQRRRQEVFSLIFDDTKRAAKYPDVPTLFVWARPLEMPVAFPGEMRQIGSSLTALPVQIEAPEPGAELLIPSPFLNCRAVPGPNSLGASVSFDNRRRQWQEQSRATETWLRFQLPFEVLPAVVEDATLFLEISAPLRTVGLSTGAAGRMVPLERRSDMVGRFTYRIDRGDALQLDERGGLQVLLDVGEIAMPSAHGESAGFLEKRWKVEALELEVRARHLSPGTASTP